MRKMTRGNLQSTNVYNFSQIFFTVYQASKEILSSSFVKHYTQTNLSNIREQTDIKALSKQFQCKTKYISFDKLSH